MEIWLRRIQGNASRFSSPRSTITPFLVDNRSQVTLQWSQHCMGLFGTTWFDRCDGQCSYSKSVKDWSSGTYPLSSMAVWLYNKIPFGFVIQTAKFHGKVTVDHVGDLGACSDRHEDGSTIQISIFSWMPMRSTVFRWSWIFGWMSPSGRKEVMEVLVKVVQVVK